MKKILLLLIFFVSFAFSAIDECKTDVYFSNGILTEKEDAKKNAKLLENTIKHKFYNGKTSEMKIHIGKVDYVYNSTYGKIPDLAESLNQILNATFGKPELFDSQIRKLLNILVSLAHDADLTVQVDKYEASIVAGHKVLVVAHSQGNLFTKEAYDKLGERSNKDNWMQKYFDAVSIASPAYYPIKEKVERIDWDNDLVARLANVGKSDAQDIISNVRKVHWEMKPYVIDENTTVVVEPSMNYVTKSDLNTMYKGRFKAIEGDAEKFDSNVHAFTFYMGKVIKDGDTGQVFINPFTDKSMVDTTAKTKIMKAIKTKLGLLDKIDSQWETDQESDKNTCAYKITVKHLWDTSIEIGEKVYPFNSSKKLYQAKNKAGAYEYVKASCGGKNILEEWDGKKEKECWMIDNPQKEKIKTERREHFFASINGFANSGAETGDDYTGSYSYYSYLGGKRLIYLGVPATIKHIDTAIEIATSNYPKTVNKLDEYIVKFKSALENILKNENMLLISFDIEKKHSLEIESYGYTGSANETSVYSIEIEIEANSNLRDSYISLKGNKELNEYVKSRIYWHVIR